MIKEILLTIHSFMAIFIKIFRHTYFISTIIIIIISPIIINIYTKFESIIYIVFAFIFYSISIIIFLAIFRYYYELNKTKHDLEFIFLSEWKNKSGILITNQSTTFSVTLSDERALTKWLRNKVTEINELRSLSTQDGWLNYIDHQIKMFEDAIKGCNARDYKAVNALGTEIENNHILLPESPIGFYVFDTSRNRLKRLYAITHLSGIEFPAEPAIKIDVGKYEKEPRPFFEAVKTFIDEDDATVGSTSWATEKGHEVIAELSISTLSYAGKLRVQEQELKRLQSNLQATLEQADRKLALRPAAKEWSATAKNSVLLAIIGLALFLGTFGLLLWGIYTLGEQFMPIVNDTDKLDKYIKIFAGAPIWSAAVITIPAILLAWLMKHFSRMFVQGFNMYSDARYRKALTQIYSEIGTRDGHELTPDQKKIIFEAMFNPRRVTHTDENISPSPVDSVFRPWK